MHDPAPAAPAAAWWRGLERRHLLALTIAYLGWVFDIMDMFLMTMVKDAAMGELLPKGTPEGDIKYWGGLTLSVTLVGWSLGGVIFGGITDRWGRTRTMALTILVYSIFTGLCGFAQTPGQLLFFRFIAALGIGGEWGAGASLIAEVFPRASRAVAAGLLQSASATGFFAAILLNRAVDGEWRTAFFAGAIPAFLALLVRLGLSEPETWKEERRRGGAKLGSLRELFADPELRRRTLLATSLALIGIFAYWGTNFWAVDSLKSLLGKQGLTGGDFKNSLTIGMCVMTVGNLVGFLAYIPLTQRYGRRIAFAVFHLGALVSMPAAFWFARDWGLWLVLFFIAGAFTSGIYSGYTISFPEMFPTRLRATGAGFCYNMGRVVAAPGPWLMGLLNQSTGDVALSGAIMGGFYALAFLVIPFLPETRDAELNDPSPGRKSA